MQQLHHLSLYFIIQILLLESVQGAVGCIIVEVKWVQQVPALKKSMMVHQLNISTVGNACILENGNRFHMLDLLYHGGLVAVQYVVGQYPWQWHLNGKLNAHITDFSCLLHAKIHLTNWPRSMKNASTLSWRLLIPSLCSFSNLHSRLLVS